MDCKLPPADTLQMPGPTRDRAKATPCRGELLHSERDGRPRKISPPPGGRHLHTVKLRGTAILTLVLSGALPAYPLPKEAPPSSEILLNANGANDALSAVGQFRAALTCTGSLIDPSGSSAPDAK